MLTISLRNVGKKFGKEWIFRGMTREIESGSKLLISGGNGSGKSTLIQVISGFITPSEGSALCYHSDDSTVDPKADVAKYISFASPYLPLIDDMTLAEMLAHIATFKPFMNMVQTEEMLRIMYLQKERDKYLRTFSSGMKQRVRLAIAIMSDTPVVLLDEPVSNLDKTAIGWYKEMIKTYSGGRTVIVCSNAITEEHSFCTSELDVTGYRVGRG